MKKKEQFACGEALSFSPTPLLHNAQSLVDRDDNPFVRSDSRKMALG